MREFLRAIRVAAEVRVESRPPRSRLTDTPPPRALFLCLLAVASVGASGHKRSPGPTRFLRGPAGAINQATASLSAAHEPGPSFFQPVHHRISSRAYLRANHTAEAARLWKSGFFLHIPKTGGTSVEAELRSRGLGASAVFPEGGRPTCCPACCGKHWRTSPWHFAPDVFESRFNRSVEDFSSRSGFGGRFNRSVENVGGHAGCQFRWCVARNPTERRNSGIAWAKIYYRKYFNATNFTSPTYSAELLSKGRFSVDWNEELVHTQPQSWSAFASHLYCCINIPKHRYPQVRLCRSASGQKRLSAPQVRVG